MIAKLLGPSADYLGAELKLFTESMTNNVKRVVDKSRVKLGARLELPGGVPPRILLGIVTQATFCDDELVAEYLAGVLAASRSEIRRDDRAVALLGTVSRLSTYQVRAHFLIYTAVHTLYAGTELKLDGIGNRALRIFAPLGDLDDAMGFTEPELSGREALYDHIFQGLMRERLIGQEYQYGDPEDLSPRPHPPVATAGVVVEPDLLGTELFLAAHGVSFASADELFNRDLECGGWPIDVRLNAARRFRSEA